MSSSKLINDRRSPKTVRRFFDEQTKREAIEALLSGAKTRAEVCAELEIQPSQLLAWMGHYTERRKAYADIEAASTPAPRAPASGAGADVGALLAGALGGNLAGLPAETRGALQEEVARALGHALLKMLTKTET